MRAKKDWRSAWEAIRAGTGDPRKFVRILVSALSALVLGGLLLSAAWIAATGPSSPLAQGSERAYLPVVLNQWAIFCNGGFEEGSLACWDQSGLLDRSVQPEMKVEGRYAALLGNPAYPCSNGVPIGEARIEQTFTVPCPDAELSFRYRVFSQDHFDADRYDSFDVYLDETLILRAGAESHEPSCDEREWDSGWMTYAYPLNRQTGPVTLSFRNVSRRDRLYNTWTYLDDVQVECCPVTVLEHFEGADRFNWWTPDTSDIRYDKISQEAHGGDWSLRVIYRKTDTYQYLGADPIQPSLTDLRGAQTLDIWVLDNARDGVEMLLKLEEKRDPPPGREWEAGIQSTGVRGTWHKLSYDLTYVPQTFDLSSVKLLLFPDPGDRSAAGTIYLDDIVATFPCSTATR